MAEPLAATLDQDGYEALDEALQGRYQKNGDSFVLQVSEPDQLPGVQGLKRNHDRLLREKKEAQDALEAFGDMTPDQVSELNDELEELRNKADDSLISPEELKDLKNRLKEATKEAKRAKDLEQELEIHAKDQRKRLRRDVESALVSSGIKPELKEAAADHIMARYKVDSVKTDEGFESTVSGEVNGVPGEHALTEFVTEWAKSEKGQPFLPPSGKGGSGADPNSRSGTPAGKGSISRTDPMAWGEKAEAIVKGEVTVAD